MNKPGFGVARALTALVGLLLLTLSLSPCTAWGQMPLAPMPAWSPEPPPHYSPFPPPSSLIPRPFTVFVPSSPVVHAPYETASGGAALNPPPLDPWLGFDKVQHATFSFLWTLGGQYILVNKLEASERQALPWSVGFTATLGLGKELYDEGRAPRNRFSHRDLAANAVGIGLAVVLIAL